MGVICLCILAILGLPSIVGRDIAIILVFKILGYYKGYTIVLYYIKSVVTNKSFGNDLVGCLRVCSAKDNS